MTRNILLLTYTFPPDNTAAAVRPGQLYDYLPQYGYQPLVVASSLDGAMNDSATVQRVPEGSQPRRVRAASDLAACFMRYFAPYDDRLPWIPFAVSAAAKLIRSNKLEAIFSTSPFLASHFAALWLKTQYKIPWIADFQDPICDNPFRSRKWIYPYDAAIESRLFRHADALVANTDTVAAAWRARYPKWSSKISVLWNSFDQREDVVIVPPVRRGYRLVAHVGSLYGERHPIQLLSTLERIDAQPSWIKLRLVGPIQPSLLDSNRQLFDRLQRKGILEFNNRLVSRDEALRETAGAEILLLLDVNKKNASFQLPSKLLDYIRYGKPILAYTPKDSPVERILAKSGIDYLAIDPRADEALEDAHVGRFLRSSSEPRSPSAWFNETFSAEVQARTVAGLLDRVRTGGTA